MKYVIKSIAIISGAVLFCAIGVWVEAVDVKADEKVNTSESSEKSSEIAPSVDYSVGDSLSDASRALIRSEQKAIINNLYKNTTASVRTGNGLHSQERAYVVTRKSKVKLALEKLLGTSLTDKKVPTIAIIASGSGYAGMLGTTGFLNGAEKIGLLNTVTYITASSGATWALALWISTGMSLSKLRSYIAQCITKKDLVGSVGEAKNITDMLAVKVACDQPVTMVDILAGVFANRLLKHYGNDCQRVYMSDQADRIKSGDYPYPIYSAIDGSKEMAGDPHCFEFTPHEVGASHFGIYVPTWAFGRQFDNSKSVDFSPEQSLGFMMATCGSTGVAPFTQAWNELLKKTPQFLVKSRLQKQFDDLSGDKQKELSSAHVFNFMFGLKDQALSGQQTLQFADAGIRLDVPYQPVSGERPERTADILIYLDSSPENSAAGIKKCQEYARKKGLKYPAIDYSQINKKTMSIFRDENDSSVPVVIYVPAVSDAQLWEENKSQAEFSKYTGMQGFDIKQCLEEGFCKTDNFHYDLKQSQQVLDQMEFNIIINKDKIVELLKWVIDRK